MRKYQDLNLTGRLLAITLTKLQEFCLKLSIINKGGNKKILALIDKMYNKLTLAHFKLFYGSDLETLLNNIRSASPETGGLLAKNILAPLCLRSIKMSCKMEKIYLGKKYSKNFISFFSFVLLGSLILNKSQSETFEILKEKIESDAKKAS
jgi:hypothetical protein